MELRSSSVRRWILLAGGALVLTFLAGWAGYGIYDVTHGQASVTVERTFAGTVTYVGNEGTSGCVRPDNARRLICGEFYLKPGTPLRQGETVQAAYELAHTGNGDGFYLIVVYARTAG